MVTQALINYVEDDLALCLSHALRHCELNPDHNPFEVVADQILPSLAALSDRVFLDATDNVPQTLHFVTMNRNQPFLCLRIDCGTHPVHPIEMDSYRADGELLVAVRWLNQEPAVLGSDATVGRFNYLVLPAVDGNINPQGSEIDSDKPLIG